MSGLKIVEDETGRTAEKEREPHRLLVKREKVQEVRLCGWMVFYTDDLPVPGRFPGRVPIYINGFGLFTSRCSPHVVTVLVHGKKGRKKN